MPPKEDITPDPIHTYQRTYCIENLIALARIHIDREPWSSLFLFHFWYSESFRLSLKV